MSLTLQEFNDNFTVKIVKFDNSINDAVVYFKVQCIPNDRVSIHTSTVDITQLTSGYTHADIISAAWDSIKTVVNTWAAFNLTENRFTEFTVTSTSDAIDVTTFNNNFIVNIIRFESVPSINPSNWCIGFKVCSIGNNSTCNNFEGLIPLSQNYCNNTLCSNIADATWDVVKDNVCEWASGKLPTKNVLDTLFVPINI
jgi:hypothetical protein